MSEVAGGHQNAPQEKLLEIRKLRLTQAVKALVPIYGPMSSAEQKLSDPNDPNSDLVVTVRLGGNLIKLTCGINNSTPVFEQLEPKHFAIGPMLISEVDGVRFEYENLIKDVQAKIDSLLKLVE